MPHVTSDYQLEILPARGLFHLNLAELWSYRDLLFLLVHRELVVKYKQTILGPAWFILQPLLMTIVFSVIFGRVAKIPTDGVPPILFYLAGLLGWSYFALTFQSTSETLVTNANLFGKVYFPRLVVPLSAVISNFFAFGLQLGTFLCFWTYFKLFTTAAPTINISPQFFWLPLVLLQIAALSLGVGLWLSALTAKYRDFTLLSALILQLWMYATPVIYPLSRIPQQWRWLASVNPMAMPVETIRLIFLGHGVVTSGNVLISVVVALVLLTTGVLLFNKIEKTFVDTV